MTFSTALFFPPKKETSPPGDVAERFNCINGGIDTPQNAPDAWCATVPKFIKSGANFAPSDPDQFPCIFQHLGCCLYPANRLDDARDVVWLPGSPGCFRHTPSGEVPEWLNGAVSKTVVGASPPRVRIPLSPPLLFPTRCKGGFFYLLVEFYAHIYVQISYLWRPQSLNRFYLSEHRGTEGIPVMKYFLTLTVGLFFTQTANAYDTYDCNQLTEYLEMHLSGHKLMTSTLVEHIKKNPEDKDTQFNIMAAIDRDFEKASKWAVIYTAMCK